MSERFGALIDTPPEKPTPRYLPARALSWTDTGGDLVLYHRIAGTYHSLNRSASAIWRELHNRPSEREIVDALAARFSAPRDAVAGDVTSFLSQALIAGLIETA